MVFVPFAKIRQCVLILILIKLILIFNKQQSKRMTSKWQSKLQANDKRQANDQQMTNKWQQIKKMPSKHYRYETPFHFIELNFKHQSPNFFVVFQKSRMGKHLFLANIVRSNYCYESYRYAHLNARQEVFRRNRYSGTTISKPKIKVWEFNIHHC